ncbi:hypothetical protein BGY98DRAFT_3330 [Russula aff. rugulosa BPL654]|nr:hypothetical protein BGY98DRAFT_3330 [Russula aff. rugulosa BPL654]
MSAYMNVTEVFFLSLSLSPTCSLSPHLLVHPIPPPPHTVLKLNTCNHSAILALTANSPPRAMMMLRPSRTAAMSIRPFPPTEGRLSLDGNHKLTRCLSVSLGF